MSPIPDFYQKPPIIERVASLYAEIDEEVFAAKSEEWNEMVLAEYPVNESIRHWVMKAKQEEDGLPDLSSVRPLLQIIPRYSKKVAKEGFDWSIRCPRGQFTINMHSDPDQGESRRFQTLRHEFEEWVPRWIDHFEVKSIDRLELNYVNALTRVTLPDFMSDDDVLYLGRVIRPFADIPGEHLQIVAPYSCEVNLLLKDKSTLRISIEDLISTRYGSGLQVNFVSSMSCPSEEIATASRILELLERAHGHIVERFEAVFTSEAKESFKPVES